MQAASQVWPQLHQNVTQYLWLLLDVRPPACRPALAAGTNELTRPTARRSLAQAKLNNKVVRFVDKRNAREMRLFTTVSTEHVADVLSSMHVVIHGDKPARHRASAARPGVSDRQRVVPAMPSQAAVNQARDQVEGAERVLYQYFSDIKSIFSFYRCVPTVHQRARAE